MFAIAELGEDGNLVFEGEGVLPGEFGALDAFDGVGGCGGAGVGAPFYYGEGSCAELCEVLVVCSVIVCSVILVLECMSDVMI